MRFFFSPYGLTGLVPYFRAIGVLIWVRCSTVSQGADLITPLGTLRTGNMRHKRHNNGCYERDWAQTSCVSIWSSSSDSSWNTEQISCSWFHDFSFQNQTHCLRCDPPAPTFDLLSVSATPSSHHSITPPDRRHHWQRSPRSEWHAPRRGL